MIKYILIIFTCLLFVGDGYAETYWVSPTGAAANLEGCSGSTPLSGASACSYDKANGGGVMAGDTVYYRAGTYSGITGSVVDPYNTGMAGNIITFSSYNSEDVQFNAAGKTGMAVNLNSDNGTVRSYIKINGLNFNNFMRHLWILKGTHNEISYCSFIGYPSTATQEDFADVFQATYIYRQAQYNWIHHCTFGLWGYNATYGYDTGGVFGVGLEMSSTDFTKYNLIEHNEMYAGAHHVAYLNGSYNIYRNNYFHNEPWYPIEAPIFSTRILAQEGYPDDGTRNLNEGNRIGYGGPKNKIEIGGNTTQVKGAYNIWRRNTWVQSYLSAILITRYSGQRDVTGNHIYNNTFWSGGYGDYQSQGEGLSDFWDNDYTHAIGVNEGESGLYVYDNVIKNNLFYQNNNLRGSTFSIIKSLASVYGLKEPEFQTVSNNWLDGDGDPKFIDISGTPDPTNATQWNFSLLSDSPCIDTGEFLTTITSASGSGTSFAVSDADFFWFDIGDMATEIQLASIESGDSIQIEGQSMPVSIVSVNYDTKTITVSDTVTWGVGDGVSIAFKGEKPDYGAYEYQPPPTRFKGFKFVPED